MTCVPMYPTSSHPSKKPVFFALPLSGRSDHLVYLSPTCYIHGRPQKFFQRGGGQNHQHFKQLAGFRRAVQKITILRRAKGANENCCVFCGVLDWNIEYLWRAPKARATILRYFVGWQHMTYCFLNSRGGGCPPCPPPCGRPWLYRWVLLLLKN